MTTVTMIRVSALAVLTLSAACGGDAVTPAPVLVGSWGGQGLAVEATLDSVSARFDCAWGTLAAPVTLDGEGRFSAPGEYVREVGPAALRNPALYEGRVTGATLDLTVFVTDTLAGPQLQVVGPFTAVRNGPAQVYACQ